MGERLDGRTTQTIKTRTMTFRTKLLWVSSLTIAGAVALVTGAVSASARQTFERVDEDRRKGLLGQFEKEMQAQGRDVESRVERAAAGESVSRIAIEANRGQDFSGFVDEARSLADAQALDFLDIFQQDGSIISNADSPARFNYPLNWLISPQERNSPKAFLTRIANGDTNPVVLAAVRQVSAGDKKIFLIGGKALGSPFLSSLGGAPGLRAMLWLSPGDLLDANGPADVPPGLRTLLARVQQTRHASTANLAQESIVAQPLLHGDVFLGALLVATSRREQQSLERSILQTGLIVAATGICLGVLMGWWTTARVTRPVAQLVSGVHAVAGGDWSTRVSVSSQDEIGQLAEAFNKMTEQLLEQRDRTLQAERVASWRELARRLAHELKNPLFPLQITIENLQRARDQHPDQFDEVFRESTATLLAELQQLKQIIAQFSDFAKMPKPEIETVDANSVVRDVLKLFEAQFQANGRPRIEPVLDLAEGELKIPADALQLSRALRNLILNAMDAMPEGGRLRIRTQRLEDGARIEVEDSGQGLTEEECARLFTPYYSTKRHGTGLGLAIVQSVVADHHGKISVSGRPGHGATFTIDLPSRREA
jgi:two-component system nitrogen regulation sensor histidine kinase NtrY